MRQALRIGQRNAPRVTAQNGHDGALQSRRRKMQPRIRYAAIAYNTWRSREGIRALEL
ncbi:hypothetical protein SAMD00023378_3840 [Ralstonia sp. NT80]|nr:hypothetical protein SAMD00023378_3840 [Ralstonia sp. NT80]